MEDKSGMFSPTADQRGTWMLMTNINKVHSEGREQIQLPQDLTGIAQEGEVSVGITASHPAASLHPQVRASLPTASSSHAAPSLSVALATRPALSFKRFHLLVGCFPH